MSETTVEAATLAQPTTDDRDAWKPYWRGLGMPWRIEPEIPAERQAYLAERRIISPDIEQGVYPFKGVEPKLTRADIEWLLATHESGGMRGPVDWDDPAQHRRRGVDLRGATLIDIDLGGLPLSRLWGGLTGDEFLHSSEDERKMASLHMERSRLTFCRMERAVLTYGHLEGANLQDVRFEGADLYHLYIAADTPVDMRRAVFDEDTTVSRMTFANSDGIGPRARDVRWGGTSLTAIEWSSVVMLQDEVEAKRKRSSEDSRPKSRATRLRDFDRAVQAYRQLATTLRGQGLNEDADRFSYRAQFLQRRVLLRQRRLFPALGSWFLDLIAGYGYRPVRSLIAYVIVILAFAGAYFVLGDSTGHFLSWNESIVISMTAFHGRGFFPSVFQPGDLQAAVAAVEAFIGLLIEIVLIATFTQRFFAR